MYYVIAEKENGGKQIMKKFEVKEEALEYAERNNPLLFPNLLDIWVNNEKGERI